MCPEGEKGNQEAAAFQMRQEGLFHEYQSTLRSVSHGRENGRGVKVAGEAECGI